MNCVLEGVCVCVVLHARARVCVCVVLHVCVCQILRENKSKERNGYS